MGKETHEKFKAGKIKGVDVQTGGWQFEGFCIQHNLDLVEEPMEL